MPHFIKYGLLVLFLLLQACAQQARHAGDTRPLAEIDHWEIRGKVSLSAEGERNTANFRWQQQGDDYEIRLHGPFGSGAAKLAREGGWVTFNDGDQKLEAASAESLLYDNTGWTLPINALRWWVKGLPDPRSPVQTSSTNDSGELSKLKQEGWSLSYKNFLDISGRSLPTKIIAQKDEIKLVMAIKSWKI